METIEVQGTVQEVAQVINALYQSESKEISITGEGVLEVFDSVSKVLKDFKVAFIHNVFEKTSIYIKIFD